MKYYFFDILPKIYRFSQKLDNKSLFTNKQWIAVDDNFNSKIVFVFRNNSELIVSELGFVKRGKWELLDNSTIIIDYEGVSVMLKHAFLDSKILALKLNDNSENYTFFINEIYYENVKKDISKIFDYLAKEYYLSKKEVAPKFYYLWEKQWFGPFTALDLKIKVERNQVNKFSFVRGENENKSDYLITKKRVKDII